MWDNNYVFAHCFSGIALALGVVWGGYLLSSAIDRHTSVLRALNDTLQYRLIGLSNAVGNLEDIIGNRNTLQIKTNNLLEKIREIDERKGG